MCPFIHGTRSQQPRDYRAVPVLSCTQECVVKEAFVSTPNPAPSRHSGTGFQQPRYDCVVAVLSRTIQRAPADALADVTCAGFVHVRARYGKQNLNNSDVAGSRRLAECIA